MKSKNKILILLFLMLVSRALYAGTVTNYIPLEVGEHWSRLAVREKSGDNYINRFYYRPIRFESLEMICGEHEKIQLRGMLTRKANSLDITVVINGVEKRHSLKVVRNDDRYFYTESLNLDIPKNTNSFHIKTRNPNAYFRHYRVRTVQLKPKTYTLEAETFANKHILTSKNTKSEYFSADENKFLTYKADADGDIHFFIRSINDNGSGATVDMFLNSQLNQTIVLSNRVARDFRINNQRVSPGRRIELKNIKKGDVITITPKTSHEIIVRMFLTTNPR